MLLTVRDAAHQLKVSCATIYALIKSGRLSCHRVGTGRGVIRISAEQIARYLQQSVPCEATKSGQQTPRPRLRHIRL